MSELSALAPSTGTVNDTPILALTRLVAAAFAKIRALEQVRYVAALRVEPDGRVFAIHGDGSEALAGALAIEPATPVPRAVHRAIVHERDPETNLIIRSTVTETTEES